MNTLPSLIIRLWRHLSFRRQRQFSILLVLMIIVSLAEIISIGAVLPFLAVLTDPKHIFSLPSLQPILVLLDIQSSKSLLLWLTVCFATGAFMAGLMRLIFLRASLRLSFAAGADLGYQIYRKTLYQPYSIHVSRNTSEVIDGITNKTSLVTDGVIMPALYVVSSVIMLFVILTTLISVAPEITLSAFLGFGIIYLVIMRITRYQLQENSKLMASESPKVIKNLQEGLGGIRDVLIDGSQEIYCDSYKKSESLLRKAYASSSFISISPRYAMEALGMVLIAVFAYFLAGSSSGISGAIPILGLLALSAQRLLPIMQQAYGSWSTLRRNQYSLIDTLNFLDQDIPDYADKDAVSPLSFKQGIVLNHVSYRYGIDMPMILNDLSLVIPKGAQVGFIGATGGGKSTLLDVVMGLLSPTSGSLQIDDVVITPDNLRSWQFHIAHVPQSIFLADTSIAENIAYGIPFESIDMARVEEAAQIAQILPVIEELPNKFKTLVGERGVRLSGGQRQRIGLARAIYKRSAVIILDEATSALDTLTEAAVMEAIELYGKDLTVLIIAHRTSTLRNCSMVVELDQGKIKRVGTYDEITGTQG